jgi:hypothetical protein
MKKEKESEEKPALLPHVEKAKKEREKRRE